jgi:hypothetical protein
VGLILKKTEFCGKEMIAKSGKWAVKVLGGRPQNMKREPRPLAATDREGHWVWPKHGEFCCLRPSRGR